MRKYLKVCGIILIAVSIIGFISLLVIFIPILKHSNEITDVVYFVFFCIVFTIFSPLIGIISIIQSTHIDAIDNLNSKMQSNHPCATIFVDEYLFNKKDKTLFVGNKIFNFDIVTFCYYFNSCITLIYKSDFFCLTFENNVKAKKLYEEILSTIERKKTL